MSSIGGNGAYWSCCLRKLEMNGVIISYVLQRSMSIHIRSWSRCWPRRLSSCFHPLFTYRRSRCISLGGSNSRLANVSLDAILIRSWSIWSLGTSNGVAYSSSWPNFEIDWIRVITSRSWSVRKYFWGLVGDSKWRFSGAFLDKFPMGMSSIVWGNDWVVIVWVVLYGINYCSGWCIMTGCPTPHSETSSAWSWTSLFNNMEFLIYGYRSKLSFTSYRWLASGTGFL